MIVLDSTQCFMAFAPLSFTRSVLDILVGMSTIREKWEYLLMDDYQERLPDYFLNRVFFLNDAIYVYPLVYPTINLLNKIYDLKNNTVLKTKKGYVLAYRGDASKEVFLEEDIIYFNHWSDLYLYNKEVSDRDFIRKTKEKETVSLSKTNTFIGNKKNIFIEQGAVIEASVLNVETGCVYISKGAEIMEGSLIRGSLYMGEKSVLKMGSKIYGSTTIGSYSKVGGEVGNSIIFSCSNKSHDGFIGNSVLGSWCNLGADTNISNLKNTYTTVPVYSYAKKELINSEKLFLGLVMGDYSKTSINTMFNTGTVVGVGVSLFNAGFPPKYIPSFSFGKKDQVYDIDKFIKTAKIVMARRGVKLLKKEEDILRHICKNRILF